MVFPTGNAYWDINRWNSQNAQLMLIEACSHELQFTATVAVDYNPAENSLQKCNRLSQDTGPILNP